MNPEKLNKFQGEEAVALYQSGNSIRKIAEQFCVSHMTIKRVLKKQGIPLRRAGRPKM